MFPLPFQNWNVDPLLRCLAGWRCSARILWLSSTASSPCTDLSLMQKVSAASATPCSPQQVQLLPQPLGMASICHCIRYASLTGLCPLVQPSPVAAVQTTAVPQRTRMPLKYLPAFYPTARYIKVKSVVIPRKGDCVSISTQFLKWELLLCHWTDLSS